MVAATGVKPSDTVLEIGPGLGSLTGVLLATGANIVAVELDQRLFDYLQKKFTDKKNLRLIKADIFRVNLQEIFKDGKYKLIANLPYSATSLVFRNFLSLAPRPSVMTVMIQREVAARLTARPGTMSLLSVTAQYYSHISYLFDLPPEIFFPRPAVESAVVQCRLKPWPDEVETKKLFHVIKAGFSGRRKQLHNTLAAGLHIKPENIRKILGKSKIDGRVRPQDLSLENWLTIAKNIN